MRLPAQELETLVIDRICDWLNDANTMIDTLGIKPEDIQNILATAKTLTNQLGGSYSQRHQVIHALVDRVTVTQDIVVIAMHRECLLTENASTDESLKLIILKVNVQLKRCGYAKRLIVTGDNQKQQLLDYHLIANIAKAHQWLALLTSGKVRSIKELAQQENVDSSHVTRMLHRAFLSPDIVRAILNRTQPVHFNLKYLKKFRALPIDWNEQHQLFGF